MARLPQPGGDSGNWGTILNDYLTQALKPDGTLKDDIVTSASIAPDAVDAVSIANGTISEALLDTNVQTKLNNVGSGGVSDGTISTAKLQDGAVTDSKVSASAAIAQSKIANLTTDLAGKSNTSHTHVAATITDSTPTGRSILTAADASAVRTVIGAGTSNLAIGLTSATAKAGDYVPSKAEVGLSNVDNTSDATKNSAAATLTNKTISGANNTLSSIPQSAVTSLTTDIAGKVDTTRTITGATSLTGGGDLTANRTISLVNDSATPGNSMYYGTNGSGAKGYYTLTAGGSASYPNSSGTATIVPRPQVFDVRDYGAAGDGIANDTAEIQAAIDAAASAGGGVVFFPAGTYLVTPMSSPALAVTSNNITLQGSGNQNTILKKTTNGVLLAMSGPSTSASTGGSTHVRWCHINDLKLEGNNMTGAALQLYYTGVCTFNNLWIAGNKDIGIDCVEFWDSRFYNLAMESNGSTTADTYTPNVYLRNSSASSGFGYSADNCNQIHFVGCRWEAFSNGAVGIEAGINNTNSPNGIYFKNCKMESSGLKGGPILKVTSACTHIYVDGLYIYAGNFAAGYSTPIVPIYWTAKLSSLESVMIANVGGVSTISSAIQTFTSGTSIQTLRNIVGRYTTAPTTAHVEFIAGGTGGDWSIEDVYSTNGTQFAGAAMPANFAGGNPIRQVAGVVSDASFTTTPLNGTLAYDTTNEQLYARSAGSWRKTVSPQNVGIGWYPSGYIAGQYYFCNSPGNAVTSNLLGNGTLRVSPMIVTRNQTPSTFFAEFTAAGDAASLLRIVIYADDGSGRPGTLVADVGSISTGTGNAGTVATAGTPGTYEVANTALLTPGIYWVGGIVQGVTTTQPTIRIIAASAVQSSIPIGTTLPAAGATIGGYTMTGQTGVPAGTFTISAQSASVPRLGFKAS